MLVLHAKSKHPACKPRQNRERQNHQENRMNALFCTVHAATYEPKPTFANVSTLFRCLQSQQNFKSAAKQMSVPKPFQTIPEHEAS